MSRPVCGGWLAIMRCSIRSARLFETRRVRARDFSSDSLRDLSCVPWSWSSPGACRTDPNWIYYLAAGCNLCLLPGLRWPRFQDPISLTRFHPRPLRTPFRAACSGDLRWNFAGSLCRSLQSRGMFPRLQRRHENNGPPRPPMQRQLGWYGFAWTLHCRRRPTHRKDDG